MNTILSRFRSRAISQTTTDSTLSTESPVTPASLDPTDPVSTTNVQRKIYPQVDSLLEEYTSEPSEIPAKPRPHPPRYPSSPKRYSVDDLILNALTPRRSDASPAELVKDDSHLQLSRPPSSASTSRHSRFMSRMSIASTAGQWSTFGRRKPERSHGQAEFGDQPSAWNTRKKGKGRASSSTRSSAGTTNNRSRASTDGTPGSRSTSKAPSSRSSHTQAKHGDKENTENTVSTPSTMGRARSAHIFTPAARQLGFDSPRTFGYPTPQQGSDNHTSGPPPLPSLDHPAFATSLLDRTNEEHGTRTPPSHPQTYPRDSRGNTIYSGDDPMSTSFSFGKSLRSYRSMPRANQVFSSSIKHGNTRSRSRTRTESHGRRISADYFSQQASALPGAMQQDWPARVAQELVRLSLTEETDRVRRSRSASAIAAGTGGQTEHKATTWPRRDNLRSLPAFNLSSSSFPSSPSPSNVFPVSSALSVPAAPSKRPVDSTNDPPKDASRGAGPEYSNVSRGVRSFLSWTGTGAVAEGTERTMQDSGNENASVRGVRKGLTAKATTTPKKTLRSSLRLRSPIPSSSKGAGETSAALAPSPVIGAGSSYLSPVSKTDATTTVPHTPVSSPSSTTKGKRKAEEVDITPPDQKTAHHATFAVPESRDVNRGGSFSRAPSAYPHRKRARLSEPSPTQSRSGSSQAAPTAQNTGTFSSRTSSRAARDSSMRSTDVPSERERERNPRRSLSQTSIPLSALVTPHAPSLSRSSAFHMRDPRRPPRKLETGWALRFRTEEEDGSPVQAWLFYVSFVLFPLWWVAAVLPTPRTREMGGTDTEKAVTLDDPQIEFDAKSWRFRCRVMGVVSVFTYIPFIVLVAIFA